jgi:hypothetical protein
MNAPQYIPSFYFYKFAEGISAPYTSFAAYRAGAIDERGNIVKPESSIDPLEYLIIKLKKIFEEIPQGMTRAKLGNYMSTMQLFGEEVQKIGITESEYQGLVEGYLALYVNPELSYIELCEDMSAQGMGTPGSSPDYNTGKVSGYDPVMGLTKRTEPVLKGLDTCEMFDVCPEEMSGFKGAKAWKHVPDSETKRYLQRYQRRNPKGHMAIRSVDPDTGKSEIHWIKLKPISFMEEFGLMDLDILNEEDQSIVAQYNDADDKPGKPSVATQTDKEELTTTGNKTMITLSANIKSDKEIENAASLFKGQSVSGPNPVSEAAMLKALTDKMIAAGYKHITDVTHRKQLGIGEFGIFPEGKTKNHSDIHVGMEHPEKKGQVHHIGIESGYSKKRSKQYLIPQHTQILFSKFLSNLGLQQTSTDVASRRPQVDLGYEITRAGGRSESGSRYDLWKALQDKLLPKYSQKVINRFKQKFKESAYEAVRTKTDDMSIIGDARRVAVVHHRNPDSVERKLSQQLMDQIGMHHTHDLEEMHFGRSPFYGGSTPQKSKDSNKKK